MSILTDFIVATDSDTKALLACEFSHFPTFQSTNIMITDIAVHYRLLTGQPQDEEFFNNIDPIGEPDVEAFLIKFPKDLVMRLGSLSEAQFTAIAAAITDIYNTNPSHRTIASPQYASEDFEWWITALCD